MSMYEAALTIAQFSSVFSLAFYLSLIPCWSSSLCFFSLSDVLLFFCPSLVPLESFSLLCRLCWKGSAVRKPHGAMYHSRASRPCCLCDCSGCCDCCRCPTPWGGKVLWLVLLLWDRHKIPLLRFSSESLQLLTLSQDCLRFLYGFCL